MFNGECERGSFEFTPFETSIPSNNFLKSIYIN